MYPLVMVITPLCGSAFDDLYPLNLESHAIRPVNAQKLVNTYWKTRLKYYDIVLCPHQLSMLCDRSASIEVHRHILGNKAASVIHLPTFTLFEQRLQMRVAPIDMISRASGYPYVMRHVVRLRREHHRWAAHGDADFAMNMRARWRAVRCFAPRRSSSAMSVPSDRGDCVAHLRDGHAISGTALHSARASPAPDRHPPVSRWRSSFPLHWDGAVRTRRGDRPGSKALDAPAEVGHFRQ